MYVTYISYRICLSPRPRAGKVGEQLSYSGLPLITPPFSFFFHSNPCPPPGTNKLGECERRNLLKKQGGVKEEESVSVSVRSITIHLLVEMLM